MKKRCVVHIPWQLSRDSVAASELRPRKMKEAFEAIGYEVLFIMGDAKTRIEQIKEFHMHLLSGYIYDFVYSESSTMPMMLTEKHHLPLYPNVEIKLFKLCSQYKVPLGLFLRDIYWAFPEIKRYCPGKTIIANLFHKLDIKIYNKYLDALFFPSDSREILYQRARELDQNIPFYDLMPGTDGRVDGYFEKDKYFLYVGSVSKELNDVEVMLKVFARHPEHQLVVCTPKPVWEKEKVHYQEYIKDNITVVHKVNDEVKQLLSKARYALCYFRSSEYQRLAIHYKVFEYLSYNIPIISNASDAVGALVAKHKLGYSISYTEEALDDLLSGIEQRSDYAEIVANIREFKPLQTWQRRAEKVAKILRKRY